MPQITQPSIITSEVQIVDGVILNKDINAAAGIALTKLAALTAAKGLYTDGSGFIIAGTPGVAQGGTGAASFTAKALLLGNGTGAFQEIAPGAANTVLKSNGTDWAAGTPPGSMSHYSGTESAQNSVDAAYGVFRTLSSVAAMTTTSHHRYFTGYNNDGGAGIVVRIKANGTIVATYAYATSTECHIQLDLYALNSTSSQRWVWRLWDDTGLVDIQQGTSSINLASAFDVTFEATNGAGTVEHRSPYAGVFVYSV